MSPGFLLLDLRVPATPKFGVQISLRYRKHLRSQYIPLTLKPTTHPAEIYLDTCDLPPHGISKLRRPSAIIDRPLLQTLQKTSEKIQVGPKAQTYG
ncbi:hypothetical protein ACTXT7_013981 [Hymenolepis weldensis]